MIRKLVVASIVVLSMLVASHAAPPEKAENKTTSPKVTVRLQVVITIQEAGKVKTYTCLLPQDEGMTARIYHGYSYPAIVLKRYSGFAADGVWSTDITLIANPKQHGGPSWMTIISSVSSPKSIIFLEPGFRGWQFNRQNSIEKIYKQFATSQRPSK